MASFSSETSAPDNLSLFSAGPEVVGGGEKAKQRRASIQSLTQMEKIRSRADKDALFTSIQETSWTVADHHRLYAIDRLQTRIMEYHNNVHRRGQYNKFQPSGVRPDDVIAFLMTCSASQSDRPFQPIEKGHLALTTKKMNAQRKASSAGSGVQWVHIMDLSALPIIAEELKLDPLCCEHFSDLRFHSMMLPMLGGCCLSVCYFQLDPFTLSVCMFKMYFYLTEGLIITFVAELMPELEAVGNNTDNERDARTVQALLAQEDVPVAIDAVFNAVVDRWEDISQRAADLGPVFVFYQLASEALVAQDTLLEFLSRTIFHFKKKTSFRLSYRKKLQLVKRMHIVNTAINLVESCTARAANVVEKLTGTVADRNIAHISSFNNANASAGGGSCLTMDSLIPMSVLGVRQLPVLADLQNSYAFAHSCLVNEAKEVRIVSEAIDSISQMRADHTALVLSLIATIFLPATFLTGVFGMNFQEHGGYTIRMVNSKYGPLVFYLLCIILAITLTTYYVSMGWIEAFGFVRFTLNSLCGKKTMMWMLGGDFEEDINDDPEVRTPKLVNVNTIAYSGNNGTTAAGSDLSSSELAGGGLDDAGLVGRGISLPAKSVASERSGAHTVRSPFAGAASHSGEGKAQQVYVQHLVPERVAEALEEEARRQEESAQRRNLAHLQGLHSSTAVAHPIMRGSLGNRPSLLQRSRLRNSRLSSGASSDYSASIGGKPAGAGSVQSGVSSSKI